MKFFVSEFFSLVTNITSMNLALKPAKLALSKPIIFLLLVASSLSIVFSLPLVSFLLLLIAGFPHHYMLSFFIIFISPMCNNLSINLIISQFNLAILLVLELTFVNHSLLTKLSIPLFTTIIVFLEDLSELFIP